MFTFFPTIIETHSSLRCLNILNTSILSTQLIFSYFKVFASLSLFFFICIFNFQFFFIVNNTGRQDECSKQKSKILKPRLLHLNKPIGVGLSTVGGKQKQRFFYKH